MELAKITAASAAEAVRGKKVSARELTAAFLSRCTALNSKLHSFLHIFKEEALAQAEAVDARISRGEAPPLAGVPVALKDDFCYRQGPTTWGAAALHSFMPPYTAAAVQKLVEAGAVIAGKTNLDQFGLGSTTATSFAGPTANPRDLTKTAGDGAAAAVAAGQCLLALSSDSGGSLRTGASHCGLFGLRSSTGLVSRHGLCMFAPSFARIGIVGRDAADIQLTLQVISGYDPRDAATTLIKDGIPAAGDEELKALKIGYPGAVFDLLPQHTRDALEPARENYTAAGAEFVEINLPYFREALQAYYVIALAETSSNLSRFDGIRFGTPAESENLEEWYCRTRSHTFAAEARRRIIIGTDLLSRDKFELYYRQAQKIWGLVQQGFEAALQRCDLIMLPVVTGPAGGLNEKEDFLKKYHDDCFCAPVSLSGLPALCVPAAEIQALPLGLQLIGRPFAEKMLTTLATRAATPFKFPPAGVL